jgi:hypothetical protein
MNQFTGGGGGSSELGSTKFQRGWTKIKYIIILKADRNEQV